MTMTTTRWTYCSTGYTAGQIGGGYGITAGGVLVYSSHSLADVLDVARRRFGLGAEVLA